MTLIPWQKPQAYVIFKNPPDYPGKFVVRHRRQVGDETVTETIPMAVAETLEDARAAIQNTDGLLCLPRGPHDDPGVIETWI